MGEWSLVILCFILAVGSICGPYLIILWLTDFKLGRDPGTVAISFSAWKSGKGVYNQWVIIWLAYSQISGLFALSYHFNIKFSRKNKAGPVLAVAYAFLGVIISIYGFVVIIVLMRNDTVCIVV